MSASTTRGGASRHGGGPYADAAAEFLALAIRLAEPDDGRVGLVLPQSILASRDAGPVREHATALASMNWSWWSPRHVFDAQVLVCALGFGSRGARADRGGRGDVGADATWSGVVTGVLGVPPLPALATDGTIGDRARCSLNFRDEYYGLIPAVSDDGDGPPLVTSGLIDPGRCHVGRTPGALRQTGVLGAPRRSRTARRADAGVGTAQARPEGARRQPDPHRRGRRRPVRCVVAGRARQLARADARRDRLGAGRRAHVAGRLGRRLARRRRHRAVGPRDPARPGSAGVTAVAGRRRSARGAQLLRDGDVLGCGRAIAAAYVDATAGDRRR